ncbi:MAG TPA: LptF/LptG family permease [Cyclobacteriaceae bacterium]|nr:LptF/LptG family permease [Cyclobacteriaceae bacterium]
MKKLDKLILGSFIGPFLLTFIVVDFILLTVNMLKYFDEIFGKGLAFGVYMELISYFVISISPMALPLAVLLSSLMTFGNLGEHFELTAIKSSGISLLRALLPIGVFVVGLSFLAFLSNNYLVPKVNLKTFSLLYDIRMKSPALDIKEGVFYNGIPNYSIKVNRKLDEVRLFDILIYDHTSGTGNINVITADSGRMEPFFNDRYMTLVLYNGNSYQEGAPQRGNLEKPVTFSRTQFTENQMVFSLDAFEMSRTPEEQWSSNRSIKNISQLRSDLDSMDREHNQWIYYNYVNTGSVYTYFARNRKIEAPPDVMRKKALHDSLQNIKVQEEYRARNDSMARIASQEQLSHVSESSDSLSVVAPTPSEDTDARSQTVTDKGTGMALADQDSMRDKIKEVLRDSVREKMISSLSQNVAASRKESVTEPEITLSVEQRNRLDSIVNEGGFQSRAASIALNTARTLKNNFSTNFLRLDGFERESRRWEIAWYQKYTQAFACVVMFMIGAPLGAIIKKGGLGMPVLFSIIFFIIYYMLTITGEKWAKEGITNALFGTVFSVTALLPFGLFFLRQARKDARLFEADFYYAFFEKIQRYLKRRKEKS